jgi:hypothetical protein
MDEGKIPGYRGYVPNMVNSFEHTYGKATREALTDFKTKTDEIQRNGAIPPKERYYERGMPILPSDIPASHRPSGSAPRPRTVESDDKFRPIPGYSGFIPQLRDSRLERTYSQAVEAASLRRLLPRGPVTAIADKPLSAAPAVSGRRESDMNAFLPTPSRLPGYQGYIPVRAEPVCDEWNRADTTLSRTACMPWV